MSRVRGANTKPEMVVRRLVHSMGYRYRLHKTTIPGKPDLAFASRRKVIFVHGCFWHRHDARGCKLARLPKSRLDFWLPKLDANVARDAKIRARLGDLGWSVLTVWECELRDADSLKKTIRGFLEA